MKRIFLFILILAALNVNGQQVLTPALQSEMAERSDEKLNVLVYLNDDFDVYAFHQDMRNKGANKDVRVKSIQKELKAIATESQMAFRNELKQLSERGMSDIEWIESFWVLNAVHLSVPASYIDNLSAIPQVERIDINSNRYTFQKPVKVKPAEAKVEGGVEKGVEVINAPALWAMGYTGRNLLLLSFDTGVNSMHPVIANRFLGNYRPLNQTWLGFRSSEAVDHDAAHSHGTHTTGTVLGLVEETHDTIGVAYGAHWIATDPIATNESEIWNPADLLGIYQWILNPDGNDETTDDVPDVINNSWGYDYDMALGFDACNMPEAQVYEVVEASGILNPFSAGNSGPGAETTGFPAMLAFSELNTFSVGAVNAHNNSLPIANFSSHGPTPCVETEGALAIKPEVSAPGVDVRSCAGINEFIAISGTSMACPHVSGALLLLKEAFPMADVVTLKNALYQTAHDLGDPGEDNVYGRGIIDVLDAYNYLANTYTPVPPVTDSFDLAVEIRKFGNDFICPGNETLTPKIAIMNLGQENLTSVNYHWLLNNNTDTLSAVWSGNLSAGEEVLIDLPQVSLSEGENSLYVWATSDDISRDFNIYNNSHIKKNNFVQKINAPYLEDVEAYETDVIDSIWFVINPDFSFGWKVKTAPAINVDNKAFAIDLCKYKPREGQEDALISSLIHLPNTNERLNLSFDLSYRKRMLDYYKDSLFVMVSTDCGQSFLDTLFANGGANLATSDGNTYDIPYVPESAADWDTINLLLSDFVNQDVMLKFMSKNDNGNNMYIDNIRIYTGDADAVVNHSVVNVEIYPNPAQSSVFVKHSLKGKVRAEIYNINGQLVKSVDLSHQSEIKVNALSDAMYSLKIYGENKVVVKPLVILREN